YSAESGLATPETSADESSDPASEKFSHTPRVTETRMAKGRASGKRSLDTPTGAPDQMAEDVAATPTRRGRPFSVDASMLAQTPLGYAQFGRPVSFTPTQDIYLQPLSALSGAATGTPPPNRHGAFAVTNLSPIPNVSDITGLGSYSSDYTDSSGRDGMVVGNASPASSRDGSDEVFGKSQAMELNLTNSSASSGVPHQPESLFERGLSQDTETAPIASLPRLRKRRSSDVLASPRVDTRVKDRRVGSTEGDFWLSGSRRFSFAPVRATRSEAGLDPSIQGWDNSGGSIVDLKQARPYSSSARYVPGGFGLGTDIWSSDVLSIPDPAARRPFSECRQRPRSMILHQPSSCSAHAVLDPTNPYLGEFLASRRMRNTRVDSCTSTVCAGQPTALWRSSAQSDLSGSTSTHHRVASQPAAAAAAATGKTSPPLQKLLSVGPCPPIAPDSHDPIPEAAYEYDDTCS
ncbi:hypothetical protein GGI22_001978, partial [Coemansia erecta]